jgi:hypothetical protein
VFFHNYKAVMDSEDNSTLIHEGLDHFFRDATVLELEFKADLGVKEFRDKGVPALDVLDKRGGPGAAEFAFLDEGTDGFVEAFGVDQDIERDHGDVTRPALDSIGIPVRQSPFLPIKQVDMQLVTVDFDNVRAINFDAGSRPLRHVLPKSAVESATRFEI